MTRREELEEKQRIFLSKTEDEHIEEFVQNNPPDKMRSVDDWFEEHQKLTGSCWLGGYKWIKDQGLKRYEMYNTLDFLDYVDGVYGGDIIKKVKVHYTE